MRNICKLILSLVIVSVPALATAQKKSDPEGFLTYSLPSTTIVLEVEAVQEKFYVGPYAKYADTVALAQKRITDGSVYGIQARQ